MDIYVPTYFFPLTGQLVQSRIKKSGHENNTAEKKYTEIDVISFLASFITLCALKPCLKPPTV